MPTIAIRNIMDCIDDLKHVDRHRGHAGIGSARGIIRISKAWSVIRLGGNSY